MQVWKDKSSAMKEEKGPSENQKRIALLVLLQPSTLHPAPCTLHPAPCTLHPAPCTGTCSFSRRAVIQFEPSFRIILWVEFAVVIRQLLGIPGISGTHPSTSGRAKAAAEKQRQVRSGLNVLPREEPSFHSNFRFLLT